jgi:hypothetical protein
MTPLDVGPPGSVAVCPDQSRPWRPAPSDPTRPEGATHLCVTDGQIRQFLSLCHSALSWSRHPCKSPAPGDLNFLALRRPSVAYYVGQPLCASIGTRDPVRGRLGHAGAKAMWESGGSPVFLLA